MLPEAHAPGSPADWLQHAHSDLALAGITPLPPMLIVDWAEQVIDLRLHDAAPPLH
jgi:hypothetical protein